MNSDQIMQKLYTCVKNIQWVLMKVHPVTVNIFKWIQQKAINQKNSNLFIKYQMMEWVTAMN